MSDTQQEQVLEVDSERDRRETRERAYQDVSLRAVELLAKAQRAADEAVAEAQSYARDLEQTAREQYRHILQRAHEAARDGSGDEEGVGQDVAGAAEEGGAASGLEAKQLEYVRTYARVAHSQLKAVLGALNDELDRLADLADGPDSERATAGDLDRSAADVEDQADRDAGHPEAEHDAAYHDGDPHSQ